MRYLNSSTLHDDGNLKIPCYNLYRGDHISNIKRRDVSIYYKIYLPLKPPKHSLLAECMSFERKIKDKLCNFIMLYRWPNQ